MASNNITTSFCPVENCQNPIHGLQPFCKKHYTRWKRWGNPLTVKRVVNRSGCSVKNCQHAHEAEGYCQLHYQRFRKTGNPLEVSVNRFPPENCQVETCEKPHYCKGFCITHYQRFKRHGDPLKVLIYQPLSDICTVEGCEEKHNAHGFCLKHYTRWKKHGDPKKAEIFFGKGKTPEEKFWSKVKKTEKCWEWKGRLSNGYGYFKYKGKRYQAHRLSFYLTHGYLSDLMVLHSCDNSDCVRPEHLKEGTHEKNMRDKIKRNRQAKGASHGMAKLTENDVIEIREMTNQKIPYKIIGKKFKISRETIGKIKSGKSWNYDFETEQKLNPNPRVKESKRHQAEREKAKKFLPQLMVIYKSECNYCRAKEDLHIDHKKSISKGGITELDNLQLLCRRCNLIKRTKEHSEKLKAEIFERRFWEERFAFLVLLLARLNVDRKVRMKKQ
jgi:5-methylcytosine-specific restriction endonuclease McrA